MMRRYDQLKGGDHVKLRSDDPWFDGKLAVVDEIKSWGAIVGIEDSKGTVYYRVAWEDMEKIDDGR